MKIIGVAKQGYNRDLIVSISEREIEHLLGSYYQNPIPGTGKKANQLEVGDIVNVEAAHSMSESVKKAFADMVAANKSFSNAHSAMLKLAEVVAQSWVRDE